MDARADASRRTSYLRTAIPWTFAGLVVFVALGVYLRFVSSAPFGVDLWWYDSAEVARGSIAYAVAVFMAQVGGGAGAIACTVIAAALLLAFRRPRDAGAVVTAMILGIAGSELTKHLVLRERPWDQLYVSSGSSFPSGHTMGAAALAVSLALVVVSSDTASRSLTRVTWLVAVLWIITMAWSRTALHVHWLSDTFAGALLGLSAAVLGRRLWFQPGEEKISGSSIVNVSPTA